MAPNRQQLVLTAHGNEYEMTFFEAKELTRRMRRVIKKGRMDDRIEKPFRLQHGKHKGKAIDEVPARYLLSVFNRVMEDYSQFMRYVRSHYNSIKLRAENERRYRRQLRPKR